MPQEENKVRWGHAVPALHKLENGLHLHAEYKETWTACGVHRVAGKASVDDGVVA